MEGMYMAVALPDEPESEVIEWTQTIRILAPKGRRHQKKRPAGNCCPGKFSAEQGCCSWLVRRGPLPRWCLGRGRRGRRRRRSTKSETENEDLFRDM